jgi:hypothetical protein
MYTYYQLVNYTLKNKVQRFKRPNFSRFFLFTTFQLNCLMSLQLPFALIPAIAFSSNPRLMGEFANGETIVLFTCSPERKTVKWIFYFLIQLEFHRPCHNLVIINVVHFENEHLF